MNSAPSAPADSLLTGVGVAASAVTGCSRERARSAPSAPVGFCAGGIANCAEAFGSASPLQLPLANKASPPIFGLERGELKFFRSKTIPKSTKIFRPVAPKWGHRPSLDLRWRHRLVLGGLKLF